MYKGAGAPDSVPKSPPIYQVALRHITAVSRYRFLIVCCFVLKEKRDYFYLSHLDSHAPFPQVLFVYGFFCYICITS